MVVQSDNASPDNVFSGEVSITRVLEAPREVVFLFWTEKQHLVRWWGPVSFEVDSCDVNPVPGGRWRICMRAPNGVLYCVGGVYKSVVYPESLSFTWAWEHSGDQGSKTEVALELVELEGAKTELHLTHRLFKSEQNCDEHRQGWLDSINSLSNLLLHNSSVEK